MRGRICAVAVCGLAGGAAGDQLVGVVFGEELVELDPMTGEVTHLVDLDPPSGHMGGMGFDGTRNRLLTVESLLLDEIVNVDELDIATGRRTRIASFAAVQADAITHNRVTDEIIVANNFPETFDLDSQLELFDSQGGRQTVELDADNTGIIGMSAHPATGRLIGLTYEPLEPARLVEIDTDSGELTDLGYTLPDRGYGALAFDPSGRFLYLTGVVGGDEFISRIELGEFGSFTDIGRIGSGYFGLAYTPSPATGLVVLGALAVWRRRR